MNKLNLKSILILPKIVVLSIYMKSFILRLIRPSANIVYNSLNSKVHLCHNNFKYSSQNT